MGWKGMTPSQFGKALDNAIADNHKYSEQLLEKILARRSPVLSGEFKADWERHISRSRNYTVIANHKEYGEKLEAGVSNANNPHSKAQPKAPNGVIRVTVIEAAPKVRKKGLVIKER